MAEVAVAGGPKVEVEHGRAVAEAVADVIRTVKADDPMAPVTVVVHSAWSGLSLRRALASGAFGPLAGGRPGLVNVAFITIARVAELLGAPVLAKKGKRPLPPAVRNEAVRAALQSQPGMFAHASRHPSTVLALDRTYEELRRCPEALVDALAASSARSAEVVRICRAARQRLSAWYDEVDLAEAALDQVAGGAGPIDEIGHLVTAGLEPMPPPLDALVQAFAARQTAAPTIVLAGEWDPKVPARSATAIVTCPDPDEEVRAVVRRIAAEMEGGTPLHRMAVLYPHDSYALILHHQLAGAGIPFTGPGIRRLGDTPAGAALSGLLDLADGHLRRNDVMDWLASGPILDSAGAPVPATTWDRISRRAGVVGGADQWDQRLEDFARTTEQKAAELEQESDGSDDGAGEWRVKAVRREAELAKALRSFVLDLIDRVTSNRPAEAAWSAWSAWASSSLERYLGGVFKHSDWPDEEQDAFVAVIEAIESLAALDDLGEPADITAFRAAASQALEAPASRVGRFGDGIMVGSLRQGRGLHLDSVWIVGLVEGHLPSGSSGSGLILDDDRAAALAALPPPVGVRTLDTRESRRARDAAGLEAALASAGESRILTWSRSELRSARPHLPSRWLLGAAAEMVSEPFVGMTELDALTAGDDGRFDQVISFASALGPVASAEAVAASLHDRDVAQLSAWVNGAGGRLEDHPVSAEGPAGAYVATAADRRLEFSRFSGKVDPSKFVRPLRHSATKLETWAACPFRWFLGEALRLSHEESPEDLIQVSARDKGTLVHKILERYTEAVISGADKTTELIVRIAEEEFEQFAAKGLTGKQLLWQYDRQLILRELRTFVEKDDLEPVAAELTFGRSGSDLQPVRIPVRGKDIPFSGSADRVDHLPQGGLMVTDYKTGGSKQFDDLKKDPVARGTKLQLHIYARAARAAYPDESGPVRARYWFVSERGRFAERSVDLDADAERFEEALDVIIGGIEAGHFPARPGDEDYLYGFSNCGFCDFKAVCPVDRDRHWERTSNAPELKRYLSLAEPSDEDGE